MLTPEQKIKILTCEMQGLTPRDTATQMGLPLIVVIQFLIDADMLDTQDMFADDRYSLEKTSVGYMVRDTSTDDYLHDKDGNNTFDSILETRRLFD